MKKKLFLLSTLALVLLAGCSNSNPITKHHFSIGCTNCSVNFENSLSIDVNENEFVKFTLTAKEGYLLPVDVRVTSDNEILIKNVDYTYTTSEDRLSGEITIKSTKAIDIYVEADERGYLYIGDNKISSSGDYSKFDLQNSGDEESGRIIYDYKTNTLTLNNSYLFAKKVNLKEYTVPFELEEATFSSLISWTGGGTLTVNLCGKNIFCGNEEIDNDCAFICPFEDGKINLIGPSANSFSEFDKGIVMNSRGKTTIKDVYFESFDLGEFGLTSRELDITNSNVSLNSDANIEQSVGLYSYNCNISNSYALINGFFLGSKVDLLVLVDSFVETNSTNTGILADWLYTYGHLEDGKYSTKIYAYGVNFGIATYDAMEFSNTELIVGCEWGQALNTVDSEILAYNCDIYVNANTGQGIHAHALDFTNCNVEVEVEDGIGIFTSIRSAQPTSREYEPVLAFNNCNVKASGGDVAIYGFGHAEIENCDNVPKYLETCVAEEQVLYLWAFVADDVTELQIEGELDPELGPTFCPTNALKEVEIKAQNNEYSGQRQTVKHVCDLEKTARLGLGKEVRDTTSYKDIDRSLEISDLHFRKAFGDSNDEIVLEYNVFLFHRYLAVAKFTIVIVDKDGNEFGAYENHYGCGEGIGKVTFTKDYCVRGNELALHAFIQDYKETGLQNYQVYLESIEID